MRVTPLGNESWVIGKTMTSQGVTVMFAHEMDELRRAELQRRAAGWRLARDAQAAARGSRAGARRVRAAERTDAGEAPSPASPASAPSPASGAAPAAPAFEAAAPPRPRRAGLFGRAHPRPRGAA
jgi:hypothetical protein